MTTTYKFKAAYTSSGEGYAPTPAPTITIVDTSNNVLINAAATTALSNLTGVYIYSYSGADDLDLVAKFDTTDANVDDKELFSYTPEEIDAMRQSLADDVIKLRDLELEKSEMVKGYSDSIKVLKIQINSKASTIKNYKSAKTSTMRASM